MKRYKLLRDLPYVKAGAIYVSDDGFYSCKEATQCTETGDRLREKIVENNPEWFSEIIEPKPQEIIEGCLTGIYNKVSSMHNGERDSILVINPTEQTRELLKGKVVERWVTDETFVRLRNGKYSYGRNICVEPGSRYKRKIFITYND